MPLRLAILAVLLAALPVLGQTAGKKYALLVAVREYEHSTLDNRRFAENDIEALAELLTDAEYAEVVVLTTTRGRKDKKAQPTVDNIREKLTRLVAKRGGRDQLLVALAGNGLRITASEGEKQRTESFFCPADAKPRFGGSLAEQRKTMIPLGEIVTALEGSGAGARLLLVDAGWGAPRGQAPSGEVDDGLPRLKRGGAILLSARSGETAHASAKLGKSGHGVFYFNVVEGLKGKAANRAGDVNWTGLADYVIDGVLEDVTTLIGPTALQTPQEIKNITGRPPSLFGTGEAIRWYERGRAAQLGKEVRRDYAEAVKWYGKAAERGHAGAMTALGRMHHEGTGVERDMKAAVSYFRQAAQRGDAEAMNELGRAYQNAFGVTMDQPTAAMWYRQAAKKENLLAMYNLGWMLMQGQGLKKDEKEAFEWFEKGAKAGDAQSMCRLGELYAGGLGVKKDEKEAGRWFARAADAGDLDGMNSLGVLYERGLGYKQDYKEAMRWYRKAADEGHVVAMYNVGWMYESGRVGKKDRKEALVWYKKAAAKGDEEAKKKVEELQD